MSPPAKPGAYLYELWGILLFVHFTTMTHYAYIDKLFFVIDTVYDPPVTYADSPLIC